VSDNTAAARGDGAGVVSGVAVGTAHVTATGTSGADGARTAAAAITVTTAPPLVATVAMGAMSYAPTSTEISVGGTVTWVNDSGIQHDVDFGTPAMHIPVFDSGQRSLTFSSAGTFSYHCNLHAGMEATIVVR
jgi:plastocyanin